MAAAIATAFMLSACDGSVVGDQVTGVEASCRAFISKSALNPETVEFYDFSETQLNGLPGYNLRVRSEGELGNKITTKYFCTKSDDGNCTCVNSEYFR